ncbi:MAG: heavy metal sensor histidine kinase [Phycisphaerales bacterium]|nr:heavy metal sensor histidine kinase [Phycisphaerales bacterium]MCB9856214.1 heavy metal sensor histidine kinase [Phycisphaerales bacterium]MCB9863347.1 heavy metal sensor histidine kinase [Phycisphaerales bacterium]
MKIGARLTLWGTLITLAACTAVCVTLYAGLSVSLHNEVDSFLEGEVQEFLAILHDEDDETFLEIEEDIRRELGSRVRNDLTFRLLDAKGKAVLASNAELFFPDPWEIPIVVPPIGEIWFETINGKSVEPATRACSMRVELPGRGEFIAQATYSLAGVNAALGRFRHWGSGVLVLAAIGAIVGGRILARKSLQPIHAMTQTARTIGANELSRRLEQTGDKDELDQLAGVLNDMLGRLERQVARIRQFTADAAHELRTPLAALRGNAEVALSEHATPESRRRVLEESIEEYDRLSRLTDDLLVLARADAGQSLIQRSPVVLAAAVRDVVELFGAVAEERKIELAFDNGVEVTIDADAERIRQVLSNVFDNALKFTPSGGRVDVDLTANADFVTIKVADTGSGIDPANLPHVFDRFYRADAARTRSTGGFGLGLPICRTIVEAHGGTITIDSTPGSGTSVVINLPMN